MHALALTRTSPTRLLARRYGIWSSTAAMIGGVAVVDGLVTGLTILGATLVAAWTALRSKGVRSWLERCAAHRAMWARRNQREDLLEAESISKHGLGFATVLVDRIMASDPTIGRYVDLDALLDRYVELELAISRCVQLDLGPACPDSSSTSRLRIRGYGNLLRRDVTTRLASAREELASITELLRLILARGELGMFDIQDDPVGDCVALLED